MLQELKDVYKLDQSISVDISTDKVRVHASALSDTANVDHVGTLSKFRQHEMQMTDIIQADAATTTKKQSKDPVQA